MEKQLLFSPFLCGHVLQCVLHDLISITVDILNYWCIIIGDNPMEGLHRMYGHSQLSMFFIIKRIFVEMLSLLIVGRVKKGEKLVLMLMKKHISNQIYCIKMIELYSIAISSYLTNLG